MFAFDGSEARLLEVKTALVNYFRKKSDECLGSLWNYGVLCVTTSMLIFTSKCGSLLVSAMNLSQNMCNFALCSIAR